VKRAVVRRLANITGAVTIAGLAAALALAQVRQAEVARRDQDKVAQLTRKMTTVCVGRFSIDRPEETRLELAQPRIDGFDIASFDEPEADFQVRLGRREARLRTAPDQYGGNKNLLSVREVNTDNGVVGSPGPTLGTSRVVRSNGSPKAPRAPAA